MTPIIVAPFIFVLLAIALAVKVRLKKRKMERARKISELLASPRPDA